MYTATFELNFLLSFPLFPPPFRAWCLPVGKLIMSGERVLRWFAEIFSMRLALHGRHGHTGSSDLYWDRHSLERLNIQARNLFELKQRQVEVHVFSIRALILTISFACLGVVPPATHAACFANLI